MQYRKPDLLMALALTGLTMTVSSPVSADDHRRIAFKGPTAFCLSHTTLMYPCISLSPPAYPANLRAGQLTIPSPELPLEESARPTGWLARMEDQEHTAWRLAQRAGVDLALGQSEPGMKMNLGPLRLNVYATGGNLSESAFFLGIDRKW